jgi:hypothetical protein
MADTPSARRAGTTVDARRAVCAWTPCVICPSRQHVAYDYACAVGQITSTLPRIPLPPRGTFRDRHERWQWDAMDAASRQTIVEVTYGEVVWSWRPDAGAKSAVRPADDGGKKARSPGRARRKPLKPSRAGMPGDSGEPAASTPVLSCCTGGCGCIGHPAFPTPSRGETNRHDFGRDAPRGANLRLRQGKASTGKRVNVFVFRPTE